MNTADYRETRFELANIKQESDGLLLTCTERGVHGSAPPPLKSRDAKLSDVDRAIVVQALGILENAYTSEFDEIVQSAHIIAAAAVEAQRQAEAAKLETARITAENLVARAEHEELTRNLAVMRAAADTQSMPRT